MGDFDTDWKITGSPDPATPDPQPSQMQAQAPVQTYIPAPPTPVFQGYNAQGQPVYGVSDPQVLAERDANILELNKLINYFSPKLDLFKAYYETIDDISKYSKTSIAPFVWGVLVCVQSIVFIFMAATASHNNNKLIFTLIAIGFMLIGAGLIALRNIKKKRHQNKLEELYVKMEEQSNNLKILYNGYSNCVLPSDYIDPRILEKISLMLQSGRYFSIGAALNSLLGVAGVFTRVSKEKTNFCQETAVKFNGTAAYFSAYRYMNIR